MELAFAMAAPMVLIFAFVAKPVLITYQCFVCCWILKWTSDISIKTLTSLQPLLPKKASSLGVGRRLGGDIAGAADSNWPKCYSTHYIIAYNIIIKAEGKGEDTESFVAMLFIFPRNCYSCSSLSFLISGWMSWCWWKVVNKIIFYICFFLQFLLFLLNCLHLNPWAVPSYFFPLFH